jgi:nucleoside-diphosphate-sugar epimerase
LTLKKHKILLIGASGFTGSRVLKKLMQKENLEVTCLLRPSSKKPEIETGFYKTVYGDLNDIDSLSRALNGQDGLIYVASLGFGHVHNIIMSCEKLNIQKAVFTSTTAILTQLNAPSKKVRKEAEQAIESSKIPNWIIIRPTMIYGLKGDRNMERLLKYVEKFPILFVPGSSKSLQQPNHVDDVANALVDAYLSSKTKNKTYNISGEKPLEFREIVEIICQILDRKIKIIHLPLKPLLWLTKQYAKFTKNPRIKPEQLLRLNENKAFSHEEAKNDFAYQPRSFKNGIELLYKSLKEKS